MSEILFDHNFVRINAVLGLQNDLRNERIYELPQTSGVCCAKLSYTQYKKKNFLSTLTGF